MKTLTLSLIASIILSTSANASVLNNLNGVDYEWMEMSETLGLSRLQVEAQLSDPNSVLFGFEYASRDLVSDLFYSYSSWDNLSGMHNAPDVVSGLDRMIKDFGITQILPGTALNGRNPQIETVKHSSALYGRRGECVSDGNDGSTCRSLLFGYYDYNDNPLAMYQDQQAGWDPLAAPSPWEYDREDNRTASYLVRSTVSAVPLPASVWLFGSGIFALLGVLKRRKIVQK